MLPERRRTNRAGVRGSLRDGIPAYRASIVRGRGLHAVKVGSRGVAGRGATDRHLARRRRTESRELRGGRQGPDRSGSKQLVIKGDEFEGLAPNPAPAVEPAPQSRLVQQRLRVTQKGLDQLQALLDAGRCDDARDLLSRIAEHVQLLRRRIGGADTAEPPNLAPQARRRKALLVPVEDNANERELLATSLPADLLYLLTGT
jgi:hypothetical protein